MCISLGLSARVQWFDRWVGNNKTWTQNQFGGNVGGCYCNVTTAKEKGSTSETPTRHTMAMRMTFKVITNISEDEQQGWR